MLQLVMHKVRDRKHGGQDGRTSERCERREAKAAPRDRQLRLAMLCRKEMETQNGFKISII